MDDDEYTKHLKESLDDACAIANSTMQFMMSRADMISCSPVMCLLVLETLVNRNIEENIKLSAATAVRRATNKLNQAKVEREMRAIIKETSGILNKRLKLKEGTPS